DVGRKKSKGAQSIVGFFFQAGDGIRDRTVTGVQTCALPISPAWAAAASPADVVAEVRRATTRYIDIANARADGYLQASGMESHHGYHFALPTAQARALATGTLDLATPPVLLYVERDG